MFITAKICMKQVHSFKDTKLLLKFIQKELNNLNILHLLDIDLFLMTFQQRNFQKQMTLPKNYSTHIPDIIQIQHKFFEIWNRREFLPIHFMGPKLC